MEAVAVQVYEESFGAMFLRIPYSENPHGNVAKETFVLQQSMQPGEYLNAEAHVHFTASTGKAFLGEGIIFEYKARWRCEIFGILNFFRSPTYTICYQAHFRDWYVRRENFNMLQHSHNMLQLDHQGLEHLVHHQLQVSNAQHQRRDDEIQDMRELIRRRDDGMRVVVGAIVFVLFVLVVAVIIYLDGGIIFSLWSSSEL